MRLIRRECPLRQLTKIPITRLLEVRAQYMANPPCMALSTD
jgi:hypothetical protein